MIDHCISMIRKKQDEANYKTYITDTLKCLIEIYAAAHGEKIDYPRFTETIVEEEPETAEDVIARITSNLMSIGT